MGIERTSHLNPPSPCGRELEGGVHCAPSPRPSPSRGEGVSDDEAALAAAFRALIPGAMLFVPMLFARFANDGTPPADGEPEFDRAAAGLRLHEALLKRAELIREKKLDERTHGLFEIIQDIHRRAKLTPLESEIIILHSILSRLDLNLWGKRGLAGLESHTVLGIRPGRTGRLTDINYGEVKAMKDTLTALRIYMDEAGNAAIDELLAVKEGPNYKLRSLIYDGKEALPQAIVDALSKKVTEFAERVNMEIAADRYKAGRTALESKRYMIVLDEYEGAIEKAGAKMTGLIEGIKADLRAMLSENGKDLREKAGSFGERGFIVANLWMGRAHKLLGQYQMAVDAFKKAANDPQVGNKDRSSIMAEIENILVMQGIKTADEHPMTTYIQGIVNELRSSIQGKEIDFNAIGRVLHEQFTRLINAGGYEREIFSVEKAGILAAIGDLYEVFVGQRFYNNDRIQIDTTLSGTRMYVGVITYESLRRDLDLEGMAEGIAGHFAGAASLLQKRGLMKGLLDAISDSRKDERPSYDILTRVLESVAKSEKDPQLKKLAERSLEAIKKGEVPAVELQIDYFRTMFADNNERTRLIGEQRVIPEEVWKKGVRVDIEKAIEKLGRIAKRTRIMSKARRERALK